MKKTIKIIDLVQAILKLHTQDITVYIPTFIKYGDDVYCFDDRDCNYYAYEGELQLFDWNKDMFDILNQEVEIIEEDKKIEHINYDVDTTCEWSFGEVYDKINEIIDAINELKGKSE